jgi:hypothetical protein
LVGRRRGKGDESIRIGSEAVHERPELQRIIGGCLMSWPFIETELALLLGRLLGSPNEAAIAVFQLIRRSTTQRDAILEAGRYTLNSDDQELLIGVMNLVKPVEAGRNALAHGHFGVSSLLPQDLLWQDTVDYLAHRTNVTLRGHKNERLKAEAIDILIDALHRQTRGGATVSFDHNLAFKIEKLIIGNMRREKIIELVRTGMIPQAATQALRAESLARAWQPGFRVQAACDTRSAS